MMRSAGYEVVHYGNAGSVSGANEEVEILSRERYTALGGCEPGNGQYGAAAIRGSALYLEFNWRLRAELEQRVEPGDTICLPFGRAHQDALVGEKISRAFWIETGIGYREGFCDFRVYESAAWMHLALGVESGEKTALGRDYWWVIPNYYDPLDWPLGGGGEGDVVFMGRLNEDKGLRVVLELARACPQRSFVLCGQGDPLPWLGLPNVRYREPIHGEGRAELLGGAALVLMPTRYVEPFGGVAAEALLCGTPVAASSFGAFPEYVIPGCNGFLCRTLADWVSAVECSGRVGWERGMIRAFAQEKFSMWKLDRDYDRVFQQLAGLREGGWYSRVTASP